MYYNSWVNFRHFLINLQQGAYLAYCKSESPELAEKSNFTRFNTLLYFYYVAVLILLEGVLVKLSGPFRLDFLKASGFTLVIPYLLYRLFLKSLIIKDFDFILSDAEKSSRIKLYTYVLSGAFCSFVIAFIIVFFLYKKS